MRARDVNLNSPSGSSVGRTTVGAPVDSVVSGIAAYGDRTY
jgi:hypothetical protein